MDDHEFAERAARTLDRIEQALEETGVDADIERKEDGVLELEFGDGSKIIVNRHAPAREIWVAARSGGFHFRWIDAGWRDTRDHSELFAALSRLVSTQAGQPVVLHP